MIPRFTILLLLFVYLAGQINNKVILHHAHAHNDYNNKKPLLSAIEHGFKSIEVDILLSNGKLFVGHGFLDIMKGQMLEDLYLKPLYKIFSENQGFIYDKEIPLYLLVDIKSSAEQTFYKLDTLLMDYIPMLTKVELGKVISGAVTIILSGNKPNIDILKKMKERYVFIDGRIDDVGKNISNNIIPLISVNWSDKFEWHGKRDISEKELNNLKNIVKNVHNEGKQLRFWGSPDNEKTWQILYLSGIDLINTDKIEKFYDYFVKDSNN
jgi:hypothetical protein